MSRLERASHPRGGLSHPLPEVCRSARKVKARSAIADCAHKAREMGAFVKLRRAVMSVDSKRAVKCHNRSVVNVGGHLMQGLVSIRPTAGRPASASAGLPGERRAVPLCPRLSALVLLGLGAPALDQCGAGFRKAARGPRYVAAPPRRSRAPLCSCDYLQLSAL